MGLVPPASGECVEYRTTLPGGHTAPFLALVELVNGETTQVAVKLRDPLVRGGHFAGTSLAVELIAAVLARAVGLSVPDYLIVNLSEPFANSIPAGDVRARALRNVGLNFATQFLDGHAMWNGKSRPTDDGLLHELEDVAVFDSAVLNGDRKVAKPNLLWSGRNVVLIDHSLALFVHQARTPTPPDVAMPVATLQQHCCANALSGQGFFYQELATRWGRNITDAALDELRSWIPPEWEASAGDLAKVFDFLRLRGANLGPVSDSLRSTYR